MSDQPAVNLPAVNLEELLDQSGLLDKAKKIDDSLYELQWGSALVVVGVKSRALVIISPLFKELPADKEAAFCRHLLGLNSALGGVASFAIQPDGWVVLHSGRDTRGMDADELSLLVSTVAELADHYDNVLLDEFYVATEDRGEDRGEASDPARDDDQPAQ
jgi:hypothetical protein